MPWDINKGAAGLEGNNLSGRKKRYRVYTVQRRGMGIMSAIELCRRAWVKLEFCKGNATDGRNDSAITTKRKTGRVTTWGPGTR